MKENGKMTCSTVKAVKVGLMDLTMKACTLKERSMDMESTYGLTNPVMMGIGNLTLFMEK